MHKIVVAVTGASGSVYVKVLMDKLRRMQDQVSALGVVMSDNAREVWKFETGDESYLGYDNDANGLIAAKFYTKNDFNAPFASGSGRYNTMIVLPCSMGTLGRIAHGVSDDLVTRAADVILKERRKLILGIRETPYNLIHIKNMELVTLAGGVICPATPSFYSQPKTVEEVAATVADRIIDLAELKHGTYRWGGDDA